jgi:hypothetical protein
MLKEPSRHPLNEEIVGTSRDGNRIIGLADDWPEELELGKEGRSAAVIGIMCLERLRGGSPKTPLLSGMR